MRRAFIPLTLAGLALLALDAAGRDAKWVEQRIKEIKNSDATAWRTIPWAATLAEAREQSRNEKRPVFLFTHAGNLETGRC